MAQKPLFVSQRRVWLNGVRRYLLRVKAPQLILLAAIVVVALRLTVSPSPARAAFVPGGIGGNDGLEDSYGDGDRDVGQG